MVCASRPGTGYRLWLRHGTSFRRASDEGISWFAPAPHPAIRHQVPAPVPGHNHKVSQQEHKAAAPVSVRCFVLTVSDTRTAATDKSGDAIVALLSGAGHQVIGRAIVKDEPAEVMRIIQQRLADAETQVVISTGGTGLTSRDSTYEAIDALLEKRLDGFGELFRRLSYDEIGPAAMLSRACAGASHGKFIAALPGSEPAVRLALVKLLIPELGHIAQQLAR
jgi:molybdenum cofactor biosynthesis protein B